MTDLQVDAVAEPSSFDEVFASARAPMVRVAFLIVGSQAVAEEIVQDAFAGLYVRFDEVDNAMAYVRTSVVAARSTGRSDRDGSRPVCPRQRTGPDRDR